MLDPFRLIAPTTVAEAASELGRVGDAAKIYAGGAELILLLRHGLVRAEYLIDVKRIGELAAITSNNGVVRIGATATHRRLERDAIVRERLPILAEAESQVGNVRADPARRVPGWDLRDGVGTGCYPAIATSIQEAAEELRRGR